MFYEFFSTVLMLQGTWAWVKEFMVLTLKEIPADDPQRLNGLNNCCERFHLIIDTWVKPVVPVHVPTLAGIADVNSEADFEML